MRWRPGLTRRAYPGDMAGQSFEWLRRQRDQEYRPFGGSPDDGGQIQPGAAAERPHIAIVAAEHNVELAVAVQVANGRRILRPRAELQRPFLGAGGAVAVQL